MPNEELEKKAKKDLPVITDVAKTLINVAIEADSVIGGRELSHDDHLGFVLLNFYRKQLEHMGSIMRLVPSRDANLIARSMLEGASHVFWIKQKDNAEEIEKAALRFRTFGIIHDLRLLRKLEAEGKSVSEENQRNTEAGIKKYGALFHTKKAAGRKTF